MRKQVWRLMQIQWKRLLTLRGDRRAIARGIALGVAINFIPTVGFGPPLVYWIAGIIKGHRVSAIVSTFGAKVAIPLLYLLNYVVGELLVKQRISPNFSWNEILNIGASFLLGGAINFAITFVITYYLILGWIERRRNSLLTRQTLKHDLLSKNNN